jgi:hypothetical protein
MPRQQKITFGEMRASGASRVIVHCGDYKCGHSSRSIRPYGPIPCGCPISKSVSFARSAATAAPMSGRCLRDGPKAARRAVGPLGHASSPDHPSEAKTRRGSR